MIRQKRWRQRNSIKSPCQAFIQRKVALTTYLTEFLTVFSFSFIIDQIIFWQEKIIRQRWRQRNVIKSPCQALLISTKKSCSLLWPNFWRFTFQLRVRSGSLRRRRARQGGCFHYQIQWRSLNWNCDLFYQCQNRRPWQTAFFRGNNFNSKRSKYFPIWKFQTFWKHCCPIFCF